MLILKTKERKAFIHLQGVNTAEGSYFRVYDLEGNKKGLIQIDRVSHTKAIGTLKAGSMAKKWNLLFVSKKMAQLEIQKENKKRQQLALIRREKLKRKLAMQRKRNRQRQLAKLKRSRQQAAERRLASFELEEDILEDLKDVNDSGDFSMSSSEDDFYQSPRDRQNKAILSYEDEPEEEPEDSMLKAPSSQSSSLNFSLGASPAGQFHFMSITPEGGRPDYKMNGMGGEIGVQANLSLNKLIDVGGFLGYRYFDASANTEECGKDSGCHLRIHYVAGSLNFKLKYLQLQKHDLWFKLEGSLLKPLAYYNRNTLKEQSIKTVHGTLGGGLGVDLNFGKFLIPISLELGLYMPPTATIPVFLTGGLRTGLLYRF